MSGTNGSQRDQQHSEHGYEHELFEQSRVPTVLVDLNIQEIRAANAAAEHLFGLPREQIVGRPGADFIAETAASDAIRERALRGVSIRTMRVLNTESGPRTAEILITPTSDEGVVFVQLVDLTDLLPDDPIERAGVRGDVDPKRVLDASPVATITVDLVTRAITSANQSATKLLGSSSQQTVGRQVADLGVRPDEVDELLTAVDRDESGKGHSAVVVLHTAMGDRAVEVSAVGLLDTPSAVLHIIPVTGNWPSRRFSDRRADTSIEATDTADPQLRRRVQIACGSALATVGMVVLVIGWWLGVDIVTRLAPELASMKANTAIGFFFIGAATLMPPTGRAGGRTALYGLLALLGATTTLEYVLDVSIGIDELLAAETDLTATSSPGRMGLNTALCFTAIGIGAILSAPKRGPRQTAAGQIAIIASGALAFLALLAYAYGASGSRGLASSTEMALHTSIAVIVAIFGILSTQLDRGVIAPLGVPLAGGRFARRIMPIGVGLVTASGLVAKALTRDDLLADPDLGLAFFALVVSASLFVVVLAVTRQSNRLDAQTERTRRDLATVMAAFSDRHFRVDVNGDAVAVTGTPSTQHAPVETLVPEEIRERLDNALALSRSEGRVTELTFTPADGEGRRELRVAPLASQHAAITIRDISELAAARDALTELTASLEDEVRARTAELEETNQELERSNSDLEQFAYLASHDLQEPLRMVSTFVDKLATRLGDDLDDRSSQYVAFAVDGAERMADLIAGLLQYSRAGREAGNPESVDLAIVVPSVLQGLSERIGEHEAAIDIADDLPHVWADEVLLRQVLHNLLGNALKFVDPSRPVHIRVEAQRVGSMVEVGVADNGVGIPAEFRDQVFLMFRRLHARTSYAGTGIGLSLVQRLVESQGGRVWIDDDHGPHGARFVFTMPATPDPRETPP